MTFFVGPLFISLGLFRGFVRLDKGEGHGVQWKTVWHPVFHSERCGHMKFVTVWPFKVRHLAPLQKAVR